MTQSAGPRQLDCPQARIALGGYVLGAIDPADQALVDAHLDTCYACLGEMAELADLMPPLALVPAHEAVRVLEAGDAARTAVAGTAVAAGRADHNPGAPGGPAGIGGYPPRRTRRVYPPERRILAVAAAAIVVGAASFGGVRLAAGPSGQDPHAAVGVASGPWQTGHGSSGTVTGTVAYRSMGWGTELAAKVAGLPMNTPCQLWIVEGNGTRVQAGSWDTDADEGAVWYPGSAQVAATAIKSFMITLTGHQSVMISGS
jgi:hypothetical protein